MGLLLLSVVVGDSTLGSSLLLSVFSGSDENRTCFGCRIIVVIVLDPLGKVLCPPGTVKAEDPTTTSTNNDKHNVKIEFLMITPQRRFFFRPSLMIDFRFGDVG